jgi:hypothetical protein
MAAYVMHRQRLLRGMGATFAFVPRRGMRGMGQVVPTDTTDIDLVTGLPCDDPRANCTGPVPVAPDIGQNVFAPNPIAPPPSALSPSFWNIPTPVAPKPVVVAATPPTLGPAIPANLQVVFPSQGTVVPAPAPAVAAAPSWFSQQMIAGIPNTYLALGVLGVVLFSMSSKRRR